MQLSLPIEHLISRALYGRESYFPHDKLKKSLIRLYSTSSGSCHKDSYKVKTLLLPVNSRVWSEPPGNLAIHTSVDVTGIH